MSNPNYRQPTQMQLPQPFGNMQNLANQFRQFQQTFKGNPQEQVQQLLNSGQMSQEQFEKLRGMAQQIQGFLK